MKSLSFIFSILLLTLIPSVLIYTFSALIYTFFDVYSNLSPFYINIITGCILFLLGGVLVAYGNDRKKPESIK